jgi:multiple sugar transport system substrate-binding protein
VTATHGRSVSRRAILRGLVGSSAAVLVACSASPATPGAGAPTPSTSTSPVQAAAATPTGAPTAVPTTASAAVAPSSAGTVSIKVNNLVDVPQLKPVFEKIASDFNTAYAGKIHADLLEATQKDWQPNLIASIVAGSPPDVDVRLQIGWLGQFGSNGWLLPLDQYMAKSDFVKDLPDSVINEGRLPQIVNTTGIKPDKPVIILPAEGFTEIMYYNKDILSKAGVKPPTTLDEFRAAVQATTDPTNGIWGYGLRGGPGGNQMWEPYLFAYGGDWFDQNNQNILVDNDQSIQAAQQDIDFFQKKYVRPEALTDQLADLLTGMTTGKFAFFNHGIHIRLQLSQPMGDKLGYIAIPKGVRAGTWKNLNGSGLLKGTKNPDAGWEYISWFFKPEYRKATTIDSPTERIPTTNALLSDPKVKTDTAFQLSMDGLFNSYGRSPNWHPKYADVINLEFHIGKQAALLGKITAKQQMGRLRDVLLGKLKAGQAI